MTTPLPIAIESYLRESGLSDTEMLVIKHLLAENCLTVRVLASKTGKGISGIDAALKKLIQRGIVHKEKVNDQPRYSVINPQSIVAWAEEALKERSEMLNRRHQSLAHFIGNLSAEKTHPAIEHFEGEQGVRKAYDKLLQNRTELLTYFDPASIPEERLGFYSQYNRRRKVYGIFQRIIAPDSPQGRRLQSRDPFEYRKTVLIPVEEFPVSFNKIIAGEVVACIDEPRNEASIIHFTRLADSERLVFEKLWGRVATAAPLSYDEKFAINSPKYSLGMQITLINGVQRALLSYFCTLFVYWLLLQTIKSRAGIFNYLFTFLFGLIPLLSGAIGFIHLKEWGSYKTTIGKALFFMSLGLACWGVGSLIWSYYNFFLNIPAPYPSLADIGFAPSIILYGIGVVYLSDVTDAKAELKNIYAKVFVILTPTITLAIAYYFIVIIARGGNLITSNSTGLKTFLDLLGPIGDIFGLITAVLISGLSVNYISNKYSLNVICMFTGLIVMTISDTLYAYTTTVGTFYPGNFGDLLYMMGVSLLSFGVLGFCRNSEID